jgi:hypothetical protein
VAALVSEETERMERDADLNMEPMLDRESVRP